MVTSSLELKLESQTLELYIDVCSVRFLSCWGLPREHLSSSRGVCCHCKSMGTLSLKLLSG